MVRRSSYESVKAFFIELGLKLEGETTVEGPSVESLIGLKDVRAIPVAPTTCDVASGFSRTNKIGLRFTVTVG